MATKKSASKRSGSSQGKAKVGKVMREFKEGKLASGGGRKVKNPKQAIAIGLSEARRAGANIPKKGAAKKKSAAKKAPAKRGQAKQATARKKTPAKKAAAKKTRQKRRAEPGA